MRTTRTLAALFAALLMAVSLPATVVAQSAGDEQYEDPLGGGGGSGGGSGGGGGNSGGGSGGDVQPAQSESGADANASQADELPRTGYEVVIPAYTGLALLLVGMVAYRLTRPVS